MRTTVDSTSWRTIDVNAVANFEDDIEIGERKRDDLESCFTKRLFFKVSGSEWEAFYALARHIEGDCDEEVCVHCKSQEE